MSNHVLRGKGKPFPYRESVCNFAQGRSVSWMLLRGVPGRHALQRSVCGFAGARSMSWVLLPGTPGTAFPPACVRIRRR